tara:strand:- start:230 stop:1402 length:1173 start_codon:yes stop_codon:yes gene_type:complete
MRHAKFSVLRVDASLQNSGSLVVGPLLIVSMLVDKDHAKGGMVDKDHAEGGTSATSNHTSGSDRLHPATISEAQVHILAQVQQHHAPVDPAPLPAESLPFVRLTGRPLLLLDLDHTLISTALEKPKAGRSSVDWLKLTLPVCRDGRPTGEKHLPVFVTPRPRLAWFLQEAAKLSFDIGIFTASKRESASPKVEWLERHVAAESSAPVFSHRFYKDATTAICSPNESRHKILFVKDLRTLLPRDDTTDPLARIVLVEDLPAVCGWQPDNVIPIEPFWGDPEDRAFERLLPVLAHVAARGPDVRPVLRALLGFGKRASMHVGDGCPAADVPINRKSFDGGRGPLGCTCTSMYEHKLLVGNFRARQPSPTCPPAAQTESKKRSREGSPLAPIN